MIKQKAGENITDENIERVKVLLERGETKVSCCEVLGIKYNTSRLKKIIDEYDDKLATQARMRKTLRNKPLDKLDITYICQAYLNGEALSEISDSIYRSVNVVKNVLVRYGVPLRNSSNNYFNPVLITGDMPEDYVNGDLVFSARYNKLAEVIKKVEDGVYRICILGNHQRYALQPYYELADLRKVQKELGIKGDWHTETRQKAWQAVVDAQKRKNKKTK